MSDRTERRLPYVVPYMDGDAHALRYSDGSIYWLRRLPFGTQPSSVRWERFRLRHVLVMSPEQIRLVWRLACKKNDTSKEADR